YQGRGTNRGPTASVGSARAATADTSYWLGLHGPVEDGSGLLAAGQGRLDLGQRQLQAEAVSGVCQGKGRGVRRQQGPSAELRREGRREGLAQEAAWGHSLEPTTTRLPFTWSLTVSPPGSCTVTWPFRWKPTEPVENCLGTACSVWPAMVTSTGGAVAVKSFFVMGNSCLKVEGRCAPRMVHAPRSSKSGSSSRRRR